VGNIVGYFARKLAPFAGYDELYQWGLIGLWDASNRWHGDEYEFQFYARTRIKGQIVDELRSSGKFVRRLSSEKQPKFTDISDLQLTDSSAVPVDRAAHSRREFQKMLDALSVLSIRESCVILLYYFEDVNLREIAAQLGVTEARACQIKTVAVQKLAEATGFAGLLP
jgi:RNA polymerase sigma factor (sigma-70 family)